jgi:hypothetical protein
MDFTFKVKEVRMHEAAGDHRVLYQGSIARNVLRHVFCRVLVPSFRLVPNFRL